MTVAVLVIWLVGAAVTRYTLEQMAYLTPIAVVVVGATIGIVLFWVKVIRESPRAAAREQTRRPVAPAAAVRRRDVPWPVHGPELEAGARSFPEVRALMRRARGLGDGRHGARTPWSRRPRRRARLPRARGHHARPVPPRRHGRGGRTAARCGRPWRADLRSRRLRRRRHLRHGACGADAEELGADVVVAPAEQVRGRLRRLRRDGRAARRGGCAS